MRRTLMLLAIAGVALASPIPLEVEEGGPAPDPNPNPEPPSPEPEPRGFSPREVGTISLALRDSGAYAHVAKPDLLLEHVLVCIQAHGASSGGAPPTEAQVGEILDAALVAYSDANGDGVADLPPFPEGTAATVYAIVSALFTSAAPTT